MSYCSPDLNSGIFPVMTDLFQSTGLCGDHCRGSYAFAIIQGYNCWCSSYIPADQVSTSNCNQGCPGIDTESCGSTSADLYSYFLIAPGTPLGTSGSSDSTTAPQYGERRKHAQCTSDILVDPDHYKLDFAYIERQSDFGQRQTVIVTPSPLPSSDALGQSSTGSGGHGVSTGKVVGIVFGVALGIGLIIGFLLWFWFRQRRRQETADFSREASLGADGNGGKRSGPNSSGGNSIPSRQVSQLSTAGLLGKSPKVMTSGGTPDLRRAPTAGSGFDRLSLGTDQRLNPWALYGQEERLSNVSLQDNQDYSRQLRVANPD
ncbi:hypothetical protein DV735_g1688, partial [Chaetothyriales sp. CBS 134920]